MFIVKETRFGNYIPFILCTFLIFALTFQSAEVTTKESMAVQEGVTQLASATGLGREKVIHFWWYDFTNFRKLAHVFEFGALGFVAVLPFYKKRFRGVRIGYALIMSELISISDECIKALLPKREFDFNDMLFDSVGIFLGIVIALLSIMIANSIRKQISHKG